jgi:hypothetical protein
MNETVFALHMFSTLALVGLIWFVQVVHYPLFDQVGRDGFSVYESLHQSRTTVVVAPLMLTEAMTAILLVWLQPASISPVFTWGGLMLVGVIWASTLFWQVPAHERLGKAYDRAAHHRLVRSNWVRTAAWTSRGLLVCWIAVQAN